MPNDHRQLLPNWQKVPSEDYLGTEHIPIFFKWLEKERQLARLLHTGPANGRPNVCAWLARRPRQTRLVFMNSLFSQFATVLSGQGSNALAALLMGGQGQAAAKAKAADMMPGQANGAAGNGLPFNVVLENLLAGDGTEAATQFLVAPPGGMSDGATTTNLRHAAGQPQNATRDGNAASDITGNDDAQPGDGGLYLNDAQVAAAQLPLPVLASNIITQTSAETAMAAPPSATPATPVQPAAAHSAAPLTPAAQPLSAPQAEGTADAGDTVSNQAAQVGPVTGNERADERSARAGATAAAVHAAQDAGLTGLAVAQAAGGKARALGQSANATTPLADGGETADAVAAEDLSRPRDGLTPAAPAAAPGAKPAPLRSGSPSGHNGSHAEQSAGQTGSGQSGGQKSTALSTQIMAALKPTLTAFESLPAGSSWDGLQAYPAGLDGALDTLPAGHSLANMASRSALTPAVTLATAHHAAAQVAVHVQQAARDGVRDFHIRLDPPELGRIDVKLEFTDDGRVMAVLAADNETTLQMFERHHAVLERALQDAGLKTDPGSLSFTLNQHGDRQREAPGQGAPASAGKVAVEQPETALEAATTLMVSDRALDIRV